jgi:single-strand DNA-binding protein
MANGLNLVQLIGFVGKDPELRSTQGGTAVANFSLATSDRWTGKDGNANERTEWHRITCWDKLATIVGQYVTKGKQLYVQGKIQSRKYTDKDNNERTAYEIIANQVVFLGAKGDAAAQTAKPATAQTTKQAPESGYEPPPMDDDSQAPF